MELTFGDACSLVEAALNGTARPALVAELSQAQSLRHALLRLRVWDDGRADDNLDAVNQLLGYLQGPNGSGQRFADDAETVMLIATSHFELDDGAYDRLLDRARSLNAAHRTALARVHAASL